MKTAAEAFPSDDKNLYITEQLQRKRFLKNLIIRISSIKYSVSKNQQDRKVKIWDKS